MKRGDVVLVRFPHPSGQRGKKRPAVVVAPDACASNRLIGAAKLASVSRLTEDGTNNAAEI
jgi:mRNA-degrading endonuclease toxin of MazEF toxin-antitoxin module